MSNREIFIEKLRQLSKEEMLERYIALLNTEKLTDYVADLEAKLAESKSKLRVSNSSLANSQLEYNKLKKEYDKQEKLLSQILASNSKLQFENNQLKQQLAEKEKEIEEVRSNHANLVADIAYKAVNVYTAESRKTGVPTFYKIHYSQLLEIEDMANLRNYAKDKTEFAIQQLQRVKDSVLDISNGYWRYFMKNGKEYMTSDDLESCINETIDQIIKELKEKEN